MGERLARRWGSRGYLSSVGVSFLTTMIVAREASGRALQMLSQSRHSALQRQERPPVR